LSIFYSNSEVPLLHDLPIEVMEGELKDGHPIVRRSVTSPKKQEEMSSQEESEKRMEVPHRLVGSTIESLIHKMFLWKGRLLKHERIFCLFPDYLKSYHDLTFELLVDKRTIPIQHRYYLALMAVSCYNCEYLRIILEE